MASDDYVALAARIKYHIQKAEFCGLKEAESTVLLKEAAAAIESLHQENTFLKAMQCQLSDSVDEVTLGRMVERGLKCTKTW